MKINLIFALFLSISVSDGFVEKIWSGDEKCQEYSVEGPSSNVYTNFFKLNKFKNNDPDDLLVGWNAPEIYRVRFMVMGTGDAKLWINRYADEEEIELGEFYRFK